MPFKAVFLDVGWTLAYPRRSIWQIFADICREAGVALEAEECERVVGDLRVQMQGHSESQFRDGASYGDSDAEFAQMFGEMAALLFASYDVPGDREALNERFLAEFWQEGNWTAFPDVEEGLMALRAEGVRVGVLSNAPTSLPSFLDALGISPHLDFAVVSASEGVRKPDRRIFEIALERADVAAEEALHVGDMFLEDILGGGEVGIDTLLIERNPYALFPNYRESHGRDLPEHRVVRDLHGVVAHVRNR